jgi:hypothetical protein
MKVHIFSMASPVPLSVPLLKAGTRILGGPQFNLALAPVIVIGSLLLEEIFFTFMRTIRKIRKISSQSTPASRGQNKPCFCGSSKKYKNFCLDKKQEKPFPKILLASALITLLFIIAVHIFSITRPDLKIRCTACYLKAFRQYQFHLTPLTPTGAGDIFAPKAQVKPLSAVARYIEENTPEKEPIFVLPHKGHYYFLSNRPSPTRFSSVLIAEIDLAYQQEVIQNSEQTSPCYVICAQDSYLGTDHNPVANEKKIRGTLILKRKLQVS